MRQLVLGAVAIAVIAASTVGARTYYIAKNGSDSNNGLDWGHPWATITKVNTTIAHGDTVRFGTGNWYSSQIVPPTGSTSAAPTVYACSTMTVATQGLAQIWAGDVVTGWTQYSGNVYQAPWTPSRQDINWETAYSCIVQNDSIFAPAGSIGGITRSGLYYYNGSTLYIWPYNNGNPGGSGRTILAAADEAVKIWSGQKHIIFFGLGLKMGIGGAIVFSQIHADSNSFVHCNIAHGISSANNNASAIFFADIGAGSNLWNYGNSFVACNIYSATSDPGSSFNHLGNGATLYSCRQTRFDSCYFYQLPGVGVHMKNGYAGYPAYGNCVSYSTFDGRGNTYYGWNQFQEAMVQMTCFSDRDSVYGCIFNTVNPSYGGDHNVGGKAVTFDDLICYVYHNYGGQFVCNNTMYNCNTFINFNSTVPDNPVTVKYNVGYDATGSNWLWDANNSAFPVTAIDSNYWYDPSAAFNARISGVNNSWTQWRALGKDLHGFNANPSLTNPAGGDFSRPAVTEMSRNYGGRNWTKFGAVQGISAPDNTAPVIFGRSITNITSTGATIVWLTDEPAHSAVDIGTNTSYGRTDSSTSLTTVHSMTISSLLPSTTYHFRVRSRDASGNMATSPDSSFTTLIPDVTPPVISGRTVTAITQNAAAIGWITNEASHTAVDIGTTTSYGRTDSSLSLVMSHSIVINSLQLNTTYHFRVRSRDAAGNSSTSGDSTFITTDAAPTENISIGLRDSVSDTYEGYSPAVINDGIIDPRGGTTTTWATTESATSAHWIVLYFDSLRTVNMAKVYWAWNPGRSSWTCSQQFNIQYWNQGTGAYVNAASVTNTTADSITTVQFSTISTTRIRYYQPANMGPVDYPLVIWLTEFSLSGPSIAPNSINDLGMLPWSDYQPGAFDMLLRGNDLLFGRQNILGE